MDKKTITTLKGLIEAAEIVGRAGALAIITTEKRAALIEQIKLDGLELMGDKKEEETPAKEEPIKGKLTVDTTLSSDTK